MPRAATPRDLPSETTKSCTVKGLRPTAHVHTDTGPNVSVGPDSGFLFRVPGSTLSQDDRPHGHLSYPARRCDDYLPL